MLLYKKQARRAGVSYLLQAARGSLSYPRYCFQRVVARRGYCLHSQRYANNILYIAGLPKSGTSWLQDMVASYAGYTKVMLPKAVWWELKNKGSHRYPLPKDLAGRFNRHLCVLKLHTWACSGNADVLSQNNIPYVILYRDLRDVAVSHYFYVRRSPWHPEYPEYSNLGIEEGLLHFAETLLREFASWIRSWKERRDPKLSMVITYEQLVRDTSAVLSNICEHFGIETNKPEIDRIVEAHAFEKKSDGRQRGEEKTDSFQRKGIVGDWRNYFTDRVRDRFNEYVSDISKV